MRIPGRWPVALGWCGASGIVVRVTVALAPQAHWRDRRTVVWTDSGEEGVRRGRGWTGGQGPVTRGLWGITGRLNVSPGVTGSRRDILSDTFVSITALLATVTREMQTSQMPINRQLNKRGNTNWP